MSADRPPLARDAMRVFWSGHSLTDRPVPDFMAAIAQSLGRSVSWDRQYRAGSSIRMRLDEPMADSGEPYDALIITEQHQLLHSLLHNDTARELRRYHDRFMARNAGATTWFYEPWLSLLDKDDPARWIAYERAASPIWQCLVTCINGALAAEGRPDRIRSLPVGLALAELAARITSGGVPGITLHDLVEDDVHLTPTGAYYVALVSHAFVSGGSPLGAWAPDELGAQRSGQLQRIADDVVQAYRATDRPLAPQHGRTEVLGAFGRLYRRYALDLSRRQGRDALRERLRLLRLSAALHWRLRRGFL